MQKQITFLTLLLLFNVITSTVITTAETSDQCSTSSKETYEMYKAKIEEYEKEIKQLREQKNIPLQEGEAFNFKWTKFDPVLPTNNVTEIIPSACCLSSYSYPSHYYGQVKDTAQYLTFATAFSIALELREVRKGMLKRGEYWNATRIIHATRSSMLRRAFTMGAAFPIFVYCCTEYQKLQDSKN